MTDALIAGPLASRVGPERLFRRTLFTVGRGESHVEELAQPIYSKWLHSSPPIETTILAAPGQIELHFVTRSADAEAAGRALAAATDQMLAALGPSVFSTDGRSMEEIVGQLLLDGKRTISAAESCTGGLMMSRLTDVPGSSAYVLGGVVAYSNAVEDRTGQRRSRTDRGARRRQRTSRGGSCRRDPGADGLIDWRRDHRYCRAIWRHASEACWHSRHRRRRRRRGHIDAHVFALRVSNDVQVPGGTDGARHGPTDLAGRPREPIAGTVDEPNPWRPPPTKAFHR